MTDIIIEILRAIVVGGIIISLLGVRHAKDISRIRGWRTLVAGFFFILFGTLIDITDNFEELGRFVIIGDTPVQAFLEKIVGYLFGFLLLAIGIKQWLPKLIEHGELSRNKHKVEVQEERLKVLRATMVTVQNIVNNFLTGIQLFQLEAEEKNALDPESLALMDSIIKDTATKLNQIAELDSVSLKKMAVGIGLDYEKSSPQESTKPMHSTDDGELAGAMR